MLRVGVERYRGRELLLSDGAAIRPGDRVVTIHFNNEAVSALHGREVNPVRAGILVVRNFERSLRALADLLERDPRYQAVKAITATTILYQGIDRFGFEVHPPSRTLANRIAAAYERFVLSRFHPLGRERGNQEKFQDVRTAWISSEAVKRRYGRA